MPDELDYSGLKPMEQAPTQGTPAPQALDFSKLKPATAQPAALDFSKLKPAEAPKPSRFAKAIKPITDIPKDIGEDFQASAAGVKEGMVKLTGKGSTPWERAKGAGQAVWGGLGEAAAPVTGPARALVGDPIRANLGVTEPKKPGEGFSTKRLIADTAETAAQIFGPGAVAKMAGAGAKLAGEAAKPVAEGIEKIFSPSTASPEGASAAALRREETGIARQQTAQAKAQLDSFAKTVNALPPKDQLDFISYVESATAGPTQKGKQAMAVHPELRPVADIMKSIYDSRRAEIQKLDATKQMSFIEDYYPHMWKEKEKSLLAGNAAPGTPKQGSGRNLKARSIPTIEEGLAQGLTPVTTNPLEMTAMYVSNMDKFIAENRILDRARDAGHVKYYTPGNQPAGWVPLDGRLANKTAVIPGKQKIIPGLNGAVPVDIPARAKPMRAYAPEGWARVYNNAISQGFRQWPMGRTLYDGLQKATNSVTQMELGLSGFHAYTMAQESMIDDLSLAIGKMGRGDLKGAAKSAGLSTGGLPIPISAGTKIVKGQKFLDQYLGVADHGPDYKKAVDLFTRAGGRAEASRAEYMRGSQGMNYWDAWRKGALKTELQSQWKDVKQRPIRGTIAQGASTIARLMDTVAHPLFDQAIPKLKNGAFFDNMQDWLAAHPGATDKEQMNAARQIVDTIDDRFGELNMDNVFWNQMMKQTLQLFIRATGWDLGTVRQIGGGAKDLGEYVVKGDLGGKIGSRIKYVLALPVLTMLSNQVWSYLKTGKPTADPFVFPTGGTNTDGTPEKGMVPGYMKDLLGYFHDVPGSVVEEGSAKIATMPKMAYELLTNRDWRNLPIAEMSDWAQERGADGPWLAYLNNVWQHYEPLSLKAAFGPQTVGTNISKGENLFGIRKAPMYLSEPENYRNMMERRRMILDREKEQSDARIKNNQQQ